MCLSLHFDLPGWLWIFLTYFSNMRSFESPFFALLRLLTACNTEYVDRRHSFFPSTNYIHHLTPARILGAIELNVSGDQCLRGSFPGQLGLWANYEELLLSTFAAEVSLTLNAIADFASLQQMLFLLYWTFILLFLLFISPRIRACHLGLVSVCGVFFTETKRRTVASVSTENYCCRFLFISFSILE